MGKASPDDAAAALLRGERERRLRLCYAGTYEREYPRNRLVIRALRDAGARVEAAHVPVFERRQDKSGFSLLEVAGLAVRLGLVYGRLLPEVALRLLRCDALVVGYIGQLDMLVLGPLARAIGRPVIFNPLVTLTDTLVEDRRRFPEGSLPAGLIGLIDRAALHQANIVLVDTVENGAFISDRFGVPQERVVVVPVGADEAIFYPDEPPEARNALDILFYGKFIPLHGIETIVCAAKLLEERGVPARIELVGTGQTYREMRALADRIGVVTITWTDWIPYRALGDRLRRADIALGVFDTGAKAGRVIPNKVWQSLACGIATITRDSPAARSVLTDGESALLVPPDDPAALADAIERLCDPEFRTRIAAGGLAAYRQHASSAALAARLTPVLSTLVERR
jgi:glycosyltransferase involved in cell wall biosynthesis